MANVQAAPAGRIAVIGAGPVGCATLAHLSARGHAAALYSPTAGRLNRSSGMVSFRSEGAVEASVEAEFVVTPDDLRNFDTLFVCLPATAFVRVLGPLGGVWRDGQRIIVSGALSLSPLWIENAAKRNGAAVDVAGWGTTLTTAHFVENAKVHVNPIRARIDIAALGETSEQVVALCRGLFGTAFVRSDNLLGPLFANINPIAHAAEVLPNVTRMDKGEEWALFGNFTEAVGRLAEALDAERRSVAQAFGFDLPSLRQHYARSYGVPEGALDQMAGAIEAKGMGPKGPSTLWHRYVLEDAPYGLAVLERLGRMTGTPTPILTGAIDILQAFYGRDFRAGNDLAEGIGLHDLDAASLYTRCAADRMAETPVCRASVSR